MEEKIKRNTKKIVIGIAVIIVLIISGIGFPTKWTLPIKGRVIDATTGKPIENVVINAL